MAVTRFVFSLVYLTAVATAQPAHAEPSEPADLVPPTPLLDSGLRPETVEDRPYLDYARECIDLLIEHGTDRYGKVHSPILMNILDVRTRDCPQDPLPLDETFRVTRRGRRGPAGANLYADQPTVRTLYDLTRVTGDARYREFAHRSLGYYLTHLVDEKGLLWWGWHRHYDAHADRMTGHDGNHHEIHFQQAMWPILWEVDAPAVRRAIEAVWEWHVIDKVTGEINRHGDGKPGCDFAFTGGEIVYAFAFLATRTGEQVWLDRARLVADYYWNGRNPETQLIATRPNAGADRFDGSHFDTSTTGHLCPRLLAAYELTDEPRFRDQAVAYLKAYDRYAWDAKAGTFWASLKLDGTPVPGPRMVGGYAQYEPRGHIDLWQPYAAGYERPIATAQAYAYAFRVTGDEGLLTAARRWAELIRREWPPRRCAEPSWYGTYTRHWAPHGTYAEMYGQTLSFLLDLHGTTGERQYLEFARTVARESVARLYYRGLFRGHPAKPYYEAIDGVGFLLRALVQLHEVSTGTPARDHGFDNW